LLVGGEGEGFLKKFRGGFEQDIDEQVKKEKRSGKDDEESKIYCGLNNGEDVDRWKNIALSKKGARSEKNGLRQNKGAATPNTVSLKCRKEWLETKQRIFRALPCDPINPFRCSSDIGFDGLEFQFGKSVLFDFHVVGFQRL
ncbi:hypothetical protein Tco_0996653, partial [Tanacetum coccineum]